MTIEEFNNTRFGSGDRVICKNGKDYPIASVDFEERLIGLLMNINVFIKGNALIEDMIYLR